jgi:riboflavin kinase/FMN adenylyltransferase
MEEAYKGVIGSGSQRAGGLGFPTINIPLADKAISGIYAGIVTVEGNEYRGALYADPKREVLEAHLLDFAGNLYGKTAVIRLLKKIREDALFDDEAALISMIESDILSVKRYFEAHGSQR